MPLIQQFDTTLQLLQKVLDLRTRNQDILSSNIANAETPGYARRSYEFEEQLRQALHGGDLTPVSRQPGHIPISPASLDQVHGRVTVHPDTTGIGDQNSVDVDQEMIRLSENQILFEAAITMLNKKLAMLKYATNDGK